MKALAVVLILCPLLRAADADVWTYWIQPCSPEIAREAHCEPADAELATWALGAWEKASAGRIALKPVLRADDARLRIFWAGGSLQLYGETRPIDFGGRRGAELYILPDTNSLGEAIAAAGAHDKLYRDSIVYLTCLHEAGHALGLPHNRDFEDIMYSFQYGGDIVEYFARYRRNLKVRDDIRRNSGLNDRDARLLTGAH